MMETISLNGRTRNDSKINQNAALDAKPTLQSPGTRASTVSHKKHYSFYLSVLMLALIALIVSWDATALSLALLTIANQLEGTAFQSFWASTAPIFGIAVTQPIYASVSHVVGRKPPLYLSILLFVVGSVIFATANDMKTVVVGHLIKGLGEGGLDVLRNIILCDITTLEERPRYICLMSLATVIGSVTGAILGGLFAEFVDWTWLGWINVLVAGIIGILAFFFLHLRPIDADFKTKLRRLDWIGFSIFIIAATAVALPRSWADSLFSWSSWQTIVPFFIGFLVLVPFALAEREAVEPIIPFRIFDNITTIASTIIGFIYGLLSSPILLYLPLLFQAIFLQARLESAKATFPICEPFVAFSIVPLLSVELIRRYRVDLYFWLGWTSITVSLGLLYQVGMGTTGDEVFISQVHLSAGLAIVLPTTMVPMLGSVRQVDDYGLAAGMLVTARSLGSLFGLTICSAVFRYIFQNRITSLGTLPEPLKPLEDASRAVGFIPELRKLDLPDEIMVSVIEAYQDTFQMVWLVLACFSALATLITFLVKQA